MVEVSFSGSVLSVGFELSVESEDLVLDPELIIQAASVVVFVSVHVTCFGKCHIWRSFGLVRMAGFQGDFSLSTSVFLPV